MLFLYVFLTCGKKKTSFFCRLIGRETRWACPNLTIRKSGSVYFGVFCCPLLPPPEGSGRGFLEEKYKWLH